MVSALVEARVKELKGCRADAVPPDVLASKEPLLLKGLVQDWPVVKAGSRGEAHPYILQFYQGRPVQVYRGEPETGGRIFYNDDFSGFNFRGATTDLRAVMERLITCRTEQNPPTFYVGSTHIDEWLPGLRQHNDLCLEGVDPIVSIWIGNQSRIASHYDVPDNIACCVAGRRRFTVFPPDQLTNLYVGPLDFTPSGRAISLVDFAESDFEKFPRFRVALRHARVAELEPGDALFLPSMWWHHVESLEYFNVLINYWWRDAPAYLGNPESALELALLTIKSLRPEQRQAWKAAFDYYVFDEPEEGFSHIPESARGMLSHIDEHLARDIKARLLKRLNR